MADLKISDLPTDIVTLADGDKFPVADASALSVNTYATALEIREYVNATTAFIRAPAGGISLGNTTGFQPVFNNPSKLTVSAGIYRFSCILYITGMSATSGNCSFTIVNGAGAATLSGPLFRAIGIDGSGAVATQTGTWSTTAGTPGNIVTATTTTSLFAKIEGWFRIATGGEGIIQPAIGLSNLSTTAIVNEPTFFSVTRVCDESVTNIGNWTTF